jgi:hypothetical protein
MKPLSFMERHTSKINRIRSLLFKTVPTSAIQTIFIPGMLYYRTQPDDFIGPHGLMTIINIFFCVSVSITFIIGTINPWFQFHRFKNWKADKSKPVDTFQVKLNQEYEPPLFDYGNTICKYVIFSYAVHAHAFIIPESTLLVITALILLYWMNKYNLFTRYAPDDMSYQLTDTMLKVYEPILFIFALGNLSWHCLIHTDTSPGWTFLSAFTLFISLVYLGATWFAPRFFEEKIVGNHYKSNIRPYTYLFSKKSKTAKTYFN